MTGELTFLFTDLEGSTRSWERDADGMDRWLAAHDGLLTRAIEASGGRVFKHTGDGLCAVFASASGAAAAAVDLQKALAGAGEEVVGPLRVRVALHAGEARERGGDFYGPTLNRCARLLEITHGGQVLLSEPVAAGLGHGAALAGGLRLADLGRHRLRDLQQPERVWQVTGPGLASGFPPLRSLDTFTHNLPLQRSSFVGREAEREALRERLAARRLVTITGIGGCGKTRLALEVGAQVVDRFPDGVFFVDLSSQTEPTLVATTILGALGLPGSAGSAEARLLEFLRDRRALLVLDNCEHLLDACAAIADDLLAACADLKILATSREPLGAEGEHVSRVPSLTLPDADTADEVVRSEAVRLFVDRAAAVRPGFALTPENAGAVAAVCRRLDGIPLALELAAARMAHLAPRELEARLSDRFRLLSGGRRGVQRQQTLQAVLDWSHDLLGEPERVLLRRLSVFAGGWTLAAAQGVCGGGELDALEVLQLLGALVARSLVDAHDRGSHTRYRLLETVRLYAQDRLVAAGEADVVRTAHAEWFLRQAEVESRGGPWFPPMVSRALDIELDNLRQAIDWWRDVGRTDRMALLSAMTVNEFHVHARFDEPEEWLEAALAAETELPRGLRARCLTALALAVEMRGEFVRAMEIARQAIATAECPSGAGGAYALLVSNLLWVAPDEAEALIEGADWAAPLGAFAPVLTDSIRATLACARHDYDRAYALVTGIDDASTEGALAGPAAGIVVTARILHGDLEGGQVTLGKLSAALAERWATYYVPFFQALIDARRGDFDAAHARVREMVALSRRWNVPLAAADGVLACAAIAFHQGRIQRSSELIGCIHAATQGFMRSPMSMCFYRHYRREVRNALDRETIARARAAGAALSFEEALASELG